MGESHGANQVGLCVTDHLRG